jgi:hypothetical protein
MKIYTALSHTKQLTDLSLYLRRDTVNLDNPYVDWQVRGFFKTATKDTLSLLPEVSSLQDLIKNSSDQQLKALVTNNPQLKKKFESFIKSKFYNSNLSDIDKVGFTEQQKRHYLLQHPYVDHSFLKSKTHLYAEGVIRSVNDTLKEYLYSLSESGQ